MLMHKKHPQDRKRTDEQLNALMNEVIVEVRKKAVIAHEQLMETLHKEIRRVNQAQEKHE